jgi:hypothetical protein
MATAWLLRLAARRWPEHGRAERLAEWSAEVDELRREHGDGGRVRRAVAALWFAASLAASTPPRAGTGAARPWLSPLTAGAVLALGAAGGFLAMFSVVAAGPVPLDALGQLARPFARTLALPEAASWLAGSAYVAGLLTLVAVVSMIGYWLGRLLPGTPPPLVALALVAAAWACNATLVASRVDTTTLGVHVIVGLLVWLMLAMPANLATQRRLRAGRPVPALLLSGLGVLAAVELASSTAMLLAGDRPVTAVTWAPGIVAGHWPGETTALAANAPWLPTQLLLLSLLAAGFAYGSATRYPATAVKAPLGPGTFTTGAVRGPAGSMGTAISAMHGSAAPPGGENQQLDISTRWQGSAREHDAAHGQDVRRAEAGDSRTDGAVPHPAGISALGWLAGALLAWAYALAVLTPAVPVVAGQAPMPGGDGELYMWVAELRWCAILLAALAMLAAVADRRRAGVGASAFGVLLLGTDAVLARTGMDDPRVPLAAAAVSVGIAWTLAGPKLRAGTSLVRGRLVVVAVATAACGPLLLLQGTPVENHPFLPVGFAVLTAGLPALCVALALFTTWHARIEPPHPWALAVLTVLAVLVVASLVWLGAGTATGMETGTTAAGALTAGPVALTILGLLRQRRIRPRTTALYAGAGAVASVPIVLTAIIGSMFVASSLFLLAGTAYPADGLSAIPATAAFALTLGALHRTRLIPMTDATGQP